MMKNHNLKLNKDEQKIVQRGMQLHRTVVRSNKIVADRMAENYAKKWEYADWLAENIGKGHLLSAATWSRLVNISRQEIHVMIKASRAVPIEQRTKFLSISYANRVSKMFEADTKEWATAIENPPLPGRKATVEANYVTLLSKFGGSVRFAEAVADMADEIEDTEPSHEVLEKIGELFARLDIAVGRLAVRFDMVPV
jgi:hypothetical protein